MLFVLISDSSTLTLRFCKLHHLHTKLAAECEVTILPLGSVAALNGPVMGISAGTYIKFLDISRLLTLWALSIPRLFRFYILDAECMAVSAIYILRFDLQSFSVYCYLNLNDCVGIVAEGGSSVSFVNRSIFCPLLQCFEFLDLIALLQWDLPKQTKYSFGERRKMQKNYWNAGSSSTCGCHCT